MPGSQRGSRSTRTGSRPKAIKRSDLVEAVRAARKETAAITEHDIRRPLTRGDCEGAVRPCPWVGCRHHLYLSVTDAGALVISFPDLEPWELKDTCALDVAARGGLTLDEVGVISNLTRERIRQIETRGLLRLRRSGKPLR